MNIGDVERVIEVVPLQEPDEEPYDFPDDEPDAVPLKTPDEEEEPVDV